MAQAGASEASSITMNGNIRAQALKLIEVEKIPLAAIARDISISTPEISTAEFVEWLGGGRKPPEFVAAIGEWINDRTTVRRILDEVGNELRANVGTKFAATIARIVISLREASDEEERGELIDHALMYINNLKSLIELMGKDQTVRSALKPGDRVVVVKSGGKTVHSNG
jgi:hypothetical protein